MGNLIQAKSDYDMAMKHAEKYEKNMYSLSGKMHKKKC